MTDFKMTDQQKGLLDKLKPLQRKVALNVVAGMSNIDAYYEAGGKAKSKDSAESAVSTMLSNVKVKVFLDSMMEAAVSDAVASRTEVMEFHTKMMRLDLSPLDKMSLEELAEIKGGIDLRLRAAQTSSKLLAEMAGYNAAQKHELTNPDGTLQQRPSVIQLVAPIKEDK